MNKLFVALGLALSCTQLSACAKKDYIGPQRFPVSGKVTVDGQPMQFGVISFLPQGEEGRVAGGPIKDGAYSVPESTGPTAGKYRVEIHWNKPTGKRVKDGYGEEIMDEYKEGLPAKYHTNSELSADVAAKSIKFDFDLKTN